MKKKFQKRPITKAQLIDLLKRSRACAAGIAHVTESESLKAAYESATPGDRGWLVDRLHNRGDLPAVRSHECCHECVAFDAKTFFRRYPWSRIELLLRRIA